MNNFILDQRNNLIDSVKQLEFYWSPQKQLFRCGEESIENEEPINTDPSHDLVHLIVAACGTLPWLPRGDRALVCIAEYCAVLLENLFDKTCNSVIFRTDVNYASFAESVKYMDWFVNEHYAPFPISANAAYQRFCRYINPFIVSRLFPYYFQVKRYERTHENYRQAKYQFSFTSIDQPNVDELVGLAQWSIYHQLKASQISLGLISSDLEYRVEQVLTNLAQPLTQNNIDSKTEIKFPSLDERLQVLELQQEDLSARLISMEQNMLEKSLANNPHI
ncbi:hypothetical protein ACSYAD_29050 [Acaryochloris marina NIES-2412]|uniref:hypothetical protein n=1 Tax=Acaryochloris marina TaxID=155978 RepID=UPI004058ACBB